MVFCWAQRPKELTNGRANEQSRNQATAHNRFPTRGLPTLHPDPHREDEGGHFYTDRIREAMNIAKNPPTHHLSRKIQTDTNSKAGRASAGFGKLLLSCQERAGNYVSISAE